MKKEDYLRGLKDAERVEAEVQRDDPTPKPAKAPKPAAQTTPEPAPAPAAAKPTPEPAAPVAPPAAPTPAELFPGFSTMPKEIQDSISAKFALAEQAKSKEDEANRIKREYQLSQQRLAPMQQHLAEAQRQRAELAEKLKQSESRRPPATDVHAALEDMRANFPTDAAIMEAALNDAEEAKGKVGAMEERFAKLEQRLHIQHELNELTRAHPDWQSKRIGVTEDGRFVRTVDTPDAEEMEIWSNSLDPYDKQIIQNCILSTSARDTIYALNRFEQDRAVARVLASQNGSGVPSDEGSHSAPPASPTPEADPNPATRQTAPTRSSAGQPVSEKKRRYLEAVALLKQQRKVPA